jgi:hypothetical protein
LGGTPAYAWYDTSVLPLRNLTFSKVERQKFCLEKATAMTGKELAAHAEKLEKYYVRQQSETPTAEPRKRGRRKKREEWWIPIVAQQCARFDADRPPPPPPPLLPPPPPPGGGKQESPQLHMTSMGYQLEPHWLELFGKICGEAHKNFAHGPSGATWHVVCIYPRRIMEWRNVFVNAVKFHKAKVKLAYHSDLAAENCRSVKAQWDMYADLAEEEHEDKTTNLKEEIVYWKTALAGMAREAKVKDGFEFYESCIAHPYMAILYVPREPNLEGPAPDGTWCLIQPYLLYPRNAEERCGLYLDKPSTAAEERCGLCLDKPSTALDIYYHSVLDFFEKGKQEGHLTKMPF